MNTDDKIWIRFLRNAAVFAIGLVRTHHSMGFLVQDEAFAKEGVFRSLRAGELE